MLEPNGNGFTLLELMVVLTIIGFISAAVVLAIPDPRGRVIEDADRFAARVAAAPAWMPYPPRRIRCAPSWYGDSTDNCRGGGAQE